MASIMVRELEIGAGIPKICVPIVECSEEAILAAAEKIAVSSADLVEWRVDWFEHIFDFEKVQEVLGKLNNILKNKPILFTCRTEAEGGKILLTEDQYQSLNKSVIESGQTDLVDVEMLGDSVALQNLVDFAHQHGVKVVGSSHDFQTTPDKEEMISRLLYMQKMGVDIAKIAVMPKDSQDVLTLLSVSEEMNREHGSTPVVAIAMGKQGMISRVAGEIFGSAITFGTVGKSSAPGQMDVEELKAIMKLIR